ncbi:MAG: Phosphate regulon transcriptional regulatory protein PhoB (SphR) [Nitrospira sp.]|nr:MAG: Phosphate regulon transcriptional regulatory protein PhoB (SphR) [Nitrospira sp.]
MLRRTAWVQHPSPSAGEAPSPSQGDGPRGPAPIVLFTTDRNFAGTIERLLVRNGYRVSVAGSVSGLNPFDGHMPELALIDRRLDLIDQFRSQAQLRRVPSIAIVPAEHHCSEEDSIRDLERGYDFVFCSDRYRELIAHIRAMFRRHRSEHQSASVLRAGPIAMDLARYEITVGEAVKAVTNKEFEILRQLVLSAGHVLSRQELLDRVWGEDYALEEHALDVHIHSLRRKIEPDPSKPRLILTVRGVGYKVQAG